MKKLPCLFVREFTPRANGRGFDVKITPVVTPGVEHILAGDGGAIPTRKFDGTACMVKDSQLFKRYDAKKGKPAPTNGIPCSDPDPETGHWPHWVPVGDEPESKWHKAAWAREGGLMGSGTYELCGPHFNGNPEGFEEDRFLFHGQHVLSPLVGVTTFDELREAFELGQWEGVVWWAGGEPIAKLRRGDFGFAWPVKAVSK